MARKPKYRLQTLLDMRERAKQNAELHLAERLKALKEATDEQARLEKTLADMIADRERRKREYAEKTLRGEMDARGATQAETYLKLLREKEDRQRQAVDAHKQVVAQREQEVVDARKALAAATQELKAMEKHKERWADEVRRAQEAREEETLDEIGQSIHQRREE